MINPEAAVASVVNTPAVLLQTAETKRHLTAFVWACNQSSPPTLAARTLAGGRMKTFDGVMQEFAAALQFPYYFGHNYPALRECITDLEWLPAAGYLIVIWDFPDMLPGRDRDLQVLLRILSDAAEEWGRPVSEGEYWDRSAIPFRILLHAEPEKHSLMNERLASVGVTARPWHLPDWVKAWIAQAENEG